jgi:hypothetical protein
VPRLDAVRQLTKVSCRSGILQGTGVSRQVDLVKIVAGFANPLLVG